jgi:PAS domain S-box-containing protein
VRQRQAASGVEIRELERAQAELEQTVVERTAQLAAATRALQEQITCRQEQERQLIESELRYRTIFENAPTGIWIASPDGRCLAQNKAMAEMSGYSRDDLKRIKVAEMYHDARDRARLLAELAEQPAVRDFKVKLRRRNGTVYDAIITASRVTWDGEAVLLKLVDDATVRLRVDELRSRFVEGVIKAQDEERRRIARELHDETGSALSSLMISLSSLDRVRTVEEARAEGREIQERGNKILMDVARLARGLHPLAIEQLGFGAAIRQYIEEYAALRGLAVDLHVAGLERDDIPRTLGTTLYRIIQEALTNIGKHANAKNVSVIVQRNTDEIRLIVEDDGRGFTGATTAMGANFGGLGIQGIRERALSLNGSFDLESTPGGGTTLFVRLPVHRESHA